MTTTNVAKYKKHPQAVAYGELAQSREDAGWKCWLMTFQFQPMNGDEATRLWRMAECIRALYALLLTRIRRKPRNVLGLELPLMFGMPDRPVRKNEKKQSAALINDGLHQTGILLVPPTGCRTQDIATVVERNSVLVLNKCWLQTVEAEAAVKPASELADYVLKMLNHRVYTADDVWIYPLAASELVRSVRHRQPV